MKDIIKISKTYIRQQLLLTAGLCLVGLLVVRIWNLDIVTPLVVAVVFNLVMSNAIGIAWRRVATQSPDNLTTLYTAVSAFRMLLALAVMLVYYLVCGSDTMLTFFLVFMAFYLVALAHHSIFFARVTNRS